MSIYNSMSLKKRLHLNNLDILFIDTCRDRDLPLIVAIDLQPMAPIEGVIQVQGDITNARTAEVVSMRSFTVYHETLFISWCCNSSNYAHDDFSPFIVFYDTFRLSLVIFLASFLGHQTF